ncbi:peroxiredoxin [Reichenbachiella versicolor]|uniref:peroxiredoxin n=1 Tax=Reichenbachiella versicolor TaxID=1821036 RepID=UPI001C8765BD|nr:peroxiredoxin [Reichenbachiella versicolor]
MPAFKLLDQNKEEVESSSLLGKKTVIFFYPKDETPVCTAEACSFQSEYETFNDLNAQVIGISADSPESHANFALKHGLKYTLLSDEDKSVEASFGLKRSFFGLMAQRVTFIFDEDGILIEVFESRFNGKKHMQEALKTLSK